MNRIKKVVLISIILFIIGSIAIVSDGFTNWDLSINSIMSERNGDMIKAKLINSGTDLDNREFQEYSFTVLPIDAMDKRIKLFEQIWTKESNENIEEYLKVDIDNTKSVFRITSLQPASTQAKVTFCCQSNEKVKATLTIDWKQKWLGYNTNRGVIVSLSDIKHSEYNNIVSFEDSIAHNIGIYNSSLVYTIARDVDYQVSRTKISIESFKSDQFHQSVTIVDSSQDINTNNNLTIECIEKMFINQESNFTYDEFVNNLNQDINSDWDYNRKVDIKKYRYFGYKLSYQCTFVCEGQTRVQSLVLYFFIETNDLNIIIIDPTSLNLGVTSIIF